MKIACPQCGQHYEVEAGMLDRYFRCTECQMLFRGLNAKPVKERKYKRKSKNSGDQNENSGSALTDTQAVATNETTSAVAVENIEESAAEAEALFWEKSLEEDAVAEKAEKYRKRSINFTAYVPVICIILLVITFVLAMLANSKVNVLSDGHKIFGDKGLEYKERLAVLEKRLDTMQSSIQKLSAASEKLERIFEHVNNKVNDKTLADKVEVLSQKLEKCEKNADELKKISEAVAEFRSELEKLSSPDNKQRKAKNQRR